MATSSVTMETNCSATATDDSQDYHTKRPGGILHRKYLGTSRVSKFLYIVHFSGRVREAPVRNGVPVPKVLRLKSMAFYLANLILL